jgi:branched-chain amino acid transport system ATP-binding protein
MTVFENLLVAACFAAGRSERQAGQDCAGLLERIGLIGKANALAGTLTLLERKQLELARALAGRPRVLLLDEIAGGLTEAECGVLVEHIGEIRRSGVSVIWIEHIVHALMSVVDRLLVINFGRMVDDGDPRAVMASPEVQEIYLGISAE